MRSLWRGRTERWQHCSVTCGKVTEKKLQLHIRCVRGHTGDVAHYIAGELADLGTRLEAQHRWWKRVQSMGDWEGDVFQAKMSSLQREKTQCEQAPAHPVDRRGESSKNGCDTAGTSSTFGSSYECNCTLGSEMGFCEKLKSYLDPQGDTMIEARRFCLDRRREKDPVKRKTLSIAPHRARQKMRRKQAILQCKEATQLGAPSRLKRSTTTNQSSDLGKG